MAVHLLRSVLLVGVLAITACGTSEPAAPTALASTADEADKDLNEPGAQMSTVRFVAARAINSAPLWLAESQGFLEEQGVNAQLESSSIDLASDALLRGTADVMVAPATVILGSNNDGQELRVIGYFAATGNSMNLLQATELNISSGCDLEGLRVGIDSPDSMLTLAVREAVRNDGCLPSRITFVGANSTDKLNLLIDGSIDLLGTFEPSTTQGIRNDLSVAMDLDDELCGETNRCPVTLMVTTDAWADENQDVIDRITVALDDSFTFISSDDIAYRAALVSCCGISAEDAADLPDVNWVGSMDDLATDLERLADIMRGDGSLQNNVDLENLLD